MRGRLAHVGRVQGTCQGRDGFQVTRPARQEGGHGPVVRRIGKRRGHDLLDVARRAVRSPKGGENRLRRDPARPLDGHEPGPRGETRGWGRLDPRERARKRRPHVLQKGQPLARARIVFDGNAAGRRGDVQVGKETGAPEQVLPDNKCDARDVAKHPAALVLADQLLPAEDDGSGSSPPASCVWRGGSGGNGSVWSPTRMRPLYRTRPAARLPQVGRTAIMARMSAAFVAGPVARRALEPVPSLPERAVWVCDRLDATQGEPAWKPHRRPA
jgi:hypothetical protein